MANTPTCRGSYVLGTNCGQCSRCATERAEIVNKLGLVARTLPRPYRPDECIPTHDIMVWSAVSEMWLPLNRRAGVWHYGELPYNAPFEWWLPMPPAPAPAEKAPSATVTPAPAEQRRQHDYLTGATRWGATVTPAPAEQWEPIPEYRLRQNRHTAEVVLQRRHRDYLTGATRWVDVLPAPLEGEILWVDAPPGTA